MKHQLSLVLLSLFFITAHAEVSVNFSSYDFDSNEVLIDISSAEEIWGFQFDILSTLDNFSKDRTEIYNLYHLLNHANIFGGSYQEISLQKLKDLRSRQ